MRTTHRALAVVSLIATFAFTLYSGWANADPPSRVARLGYLDGAVSFSPAGESDWVQANLNRPVTIGDRLWTDSGARAELQVGGATIRLSGDSGLSVLNLDERLTQLQLTQGTITVRVRRLDPEQVLEVDTPNLAFTLRQPGEYRMQVEPDGAATSIYVRRGQGEVYGEDASYVIDSRQSYRFAGTGLRDYEALGAPQPDDFDRWATDRERRFDASVSARYVSPDVVGYQDLDANGTWRVEPDYGNVWVPSRVPSGWAPYRDGHWAWIDPWGWTWIDDAPWGFAVSHYGRWANMRGTWGWVPGPVRTRAYYAPALVAFVGGNNFSLTLSSGGGGSIGWFPLGPREVYRPAYPVSRRYFENVNVSNTVVNTTVINNYYNNVNVTNVVYANRQVPGAVVAVPTSAFVQSQPVSRAAVRVSREAVVNATIGAVAPVAPTERSVRGAASDARDKPPARVFDRRVVARHAPAPTPVGFAAQERELAAKPGRPLDDAARRALKPAAPAPAPTVNVVQETEKAPPSKRPPPAGEGRAAGKGGDAKGPAVEPKGATPPGTAPIVPQGQPVEIPAKGKGAPAKGEPPAKGEAPPKGGERRPIGTPPPRARTPDANAPPQAAPATPAPPAPAPGIAPPSKPAGPEAAPPKAAPAPTPPAEPNQDKGRPGQRNNKADARDRPAASPPPGGAPAPGSTPQAVTPMPATPPSPPKSAPAQAVPAPQAAPAPAPAPRPEAQGNGENRGKAEKRERPERAAPSGPPNQPVQRAAPAPVAPQQAAPPPPQPGPKAQPAPPQPKAQPAPPPPAPKVQPAPAAPQAAPAPPPKQERPPKKEGGGDKRDDDKQKGG